jgi:butyrate response factor 1
MIKHSENQPQQTYEVKKHQKPRYKKDALVPVDFGKESRKDPKYKTELCMTFANSGFCAYGNKCRFAHGKEDLFFKEVTHPKYRKSDCLTFHTTGACTYGTRCHFRHLPKPHLSQVNRSYYSWQLATVGESLQMNSRRLPIFQSCTKRNHLDFLKLNSIPLSSHWECNSLTSTASLCSGSNAASLTLSPIRQMPFNNIDNGGKNMQMLWNILCNKGLVGQQLEF